jgi:CBS domain-containing protein
LGIIALALTGSPNWPPAQKPAVLWNARVRHCIPPSSVAFSLARGGVDSAGEGVIVAETIASILKGKGQETWSVTPDATVYDSIALMAQKGIGAVLVISQGKLTGIISERDYARKIVLEGRSSRGTRVREIMTPDPVTARPENTVEECMSIMTQCRVRHLPVLDGENLIGIVSIGDLVKAVIADQAHTIDQLQTYIGGKYPG